MHTGRIDLFSKLKMPIHSMTLVESINEPFLLNNLSRVKYYTTVLFVSISVYVWGHSLTTLTNFNDFDPLR